MNQVKTYTREELYDLVWSMPMFKVAKEFELSDKGLAKKCKKHKIPVPPVGYWTKLQNGKKVIKARLSKNTIPALKMIKFYPKAPISEAVLKSKSNLTDKQLEKASTFTIPKRVNHYHQMIQECRKGKHDRLDTYGRVICNSTIKVTPGTFDRACLFLEGIIRLFDAYGWRFTNDNSHHTHRKRGAFTFNGEVLYIEIKEPVRQIPYESKGKPEDRYWQPSYEYLPTGILEFRIDNIYAAGFKTRWSDNKNVKLEEQMDTIVQSFSRGFEFCKFRTLENERKHQEWQRAQDRRKESLKVKEIEKKRQQYLFSLADDYEKAESVRVLIKAIKNSEQDITELDDWFAWASKVAEDVDPVQRMDEIMAEHDSFGRN